MTMKNSKRGVDPQGPPATDEMRITPAHVAEAAERLRDYKAGKQSLDARLADEMSWWHGRYGREGRAGHGNSTSAWLFNSIAHKHADLCDNYPVCRALPREARDEQEAAMLSAILPVIVERCDFEKIYSDNGWSKLKHGMAGYGVFWNPALENGFGDIDVRRVDVANLYWAPGVSDIQESPHLYLVSLEDTESLVSRYPMLAEQEIMSRSGAVPDTGGSYLAGSESTRGKTAVVDWYYKETRPDGRTLLHYAKLVGETLLYASENDPLYADRGWYDHGQYPFVLDVFFPREGTPEGYGLISVGRNAQGYIDELDGRLMEYANWASRVRYWAKRSLGVNEQDFLDLDRHIVEVEGDIDEEKLKQITLSPMDGALAELRKMKIEELKETTGTKDVSLGGTSGGVTAASAITALQEAGEKSSRDCLAGTYRAYVQIMRQVIELIRQFYDSARTFRICGAEEGKFSYLTYSNRGITDQVNGERRDGEISYYRPIFDIDVKAEKQSPHSRAERNRLMLSLYESGMLDEGRERAALRALEGMEFEGASALRASLQAAIGGPEG